MTLARLKVGKETFEMHVTLGRVRRDAPGINPDDIHRALSLHQSGRICTFPSTMDSIKGLINDLAGGRGAEIVSHHVDSKMRSFKITTYTARNETWVTLA